MEGRPIALQPIGQGVYRNRANTIGNTENIWEVNLNALKKTIKPGNKNTRAEERNISWANKPLKKSNLPHLPPSPNGTNAKARKSRKTRKARKARKTRRQRK